MKRYLYLLETIFVLLLCSSCESNISNDSSVFKTEDLLICSLKLPDGYPQSQTHAGISYIEDSLCKYKYWLVTTPYPNITSGYGDQFENPMLYFANELESNPPIDFNDYEYNPLVERPTVYKNTSYNSDPDIFYKDSTVHIIYRTYQPGFPLYKGANYTYDKLSICYIQSIVKGNVLLGFTEPVDLLTANLDLYEDCYPYISPSLIYYKNLYRIFYLVTNTYNDGKATRYLKMLSSNQLNTIEFIEKDIYLLTGDLNPWHMSVFEYNDKLYSIVCCTKNGNKKLCYQYLVQVTTPTSTVTISSST